MGGFYWFTVIVFAYLTVGVTMAYYLAKADSEWTADYGLFREYRESPGPGSVTFVIFVWPAVPLVEILTKIGEQFKRDVEARRAQNEEAEK